MEFDPLSNQVIGCALEVHRELGPGLMESTYQACLAHELSQAGFCFALQQPIPVQYKGVRLECGYRVDLLVENSLIVEIKAVNQIEEIHKAQLLTYLRLAKIRVGLLINFNSRLLKEGIRRFVL